MSYLEAEYESGYIHRQDAQDHSPYVRGSNTFGDILHKRPEPIHGRMVRFSLVTPEHTYSVDWTVLPDNARPIHAVDYEADFVGSDMTDKREVRRIFGFQYTDQDGRNHKEVTEI